MYLTSCESGPAGVVAAGLSCWASCALLAAVFPRSVASSADAPPAAASAAVVAAVAAISARLGANFCGVMSRSALSSAMDEILTANSLQDHPIPGVDLCAASAPREPPCTMRSRRRHCERTVGRTWCGLQLVCDLTEE